MPHTGAIYTIAEAHDVLKSGEFSDFEIRCNDHVFRVHRLILVAKSGFFNAVINDDFEEKLDGAVDLSEFEPGAVAWMIFHCYTNYIPASSHETPWPQYFRKFEDCYNGGTSPMESKFVYLIKVYSLADYLLLRDLKGAVALFFLSSLQRFSNQLLKKDRHDWQCFLPVLEQCYDKLPESDMHVRPLFTAWALSSRKAGEDGRREVLQEVVKQKDPATWMAITAFRSGAEGSRSMDEDWKALIEKW
jgi:hypothetical protein